MKGWIVSVALILSAGGFAGNVCAEDSFSESISSKAYCNNQCQRSLIEQYYAKINRATMHDSSLEHVDDFLNVLHDDVLYLHTEYQAEFNKDIWRKAFLRQIENGRYNNTEEAGTSIESIIHGHQTAAVEFIRYYNDDETNELITTPKRLAIFKFQDDKIVFIQDHWYHEVE